MIAAIADGAGSATRAEVGAGIACSLAFQEVESWIRSEGGVCEIDRGQVEKWIDTIRAVISRKAEFDGLSVRDYACTLLIAVVGVQAANFVQIGDGAIVVGRDSGYAPVFWPEPGEYANMTYFLTDEFAFDHMQFKVESEVFDEIALFTDGIQRLALRYDLQTAHDPFFEPMFARLRSESADAPLDDLTIQLAAFLNSGPINERTDDDKTLVLATRRG